MPSSLNDRVGAFYASAVERRILSGLRCLTGRGEGVVCPMDRRFWGVFSRDLYRMARGCVGWGPRFWFDGSGGGFPFVFVFVLFWRGVTDASPNWLWDGLSVGA